MKKMTCHVVAEQFGNADVWAERVLWDEWYGFTCMPDFPEGRKLTLFIHVLGISVIHEACDAAHNWALYSLCGPLIWMPGLPQLPEMWTRKMVVHRGTHGWEWFWHLFRVLSHFSMDQCPAHINFTWVISNSKHSQQGYGSLVPKSFGTKPRDIIVQSMCKQHMLSSYCSPHHNTGTAVSTGLWPYNMWIPICIFSCCKSKCWKFFFFFFAEPYSWNQHWELLWGKRTYPSPAFYFLTCNLKLNRSTPDN